MEKAPLARCDECPLQSAPFVPTLFRPDADIIIVGEAPGALEVELGRPFVGPSGQLLDRLISSVGGMPDKTSRTNVVSCRPPNNREPTLVELSCCRARLLNEVRSAPGAVVLALGATAKQALCPDAATGIFYDATYTGDRIPGAVSPDLIAKRIIHTWHPAYVLRKPSALEELKRDLAKVFNRSAVPFIADPTVFIVGKPEGVHGMVNSLIALGDKIVFDFETSQINWQRDAMLCLGLACSPDYAYIVTDEMLYDSPEARADLQRLFSSPAVQLVAHHGKFDLHFLWHQLGAVDARVDFDTLVAHYALVEVFPHDLKTLLSWYFGYPDYERDLVLRHLRTKSDDYSKVPPDDLYKYCAMDVCGTYRLATRLEIDLRVQGLYDSPFMSVLMPATNALGRLEARGIGVDLPFLKEWDGRMAEDIERLTGLLRGLSNRSFLNPNSWMQMAECLWDDMKLRPNPNARSNQERRKKGKTDNRSTAEDALDHLASINAKSGKKVRDGVPFVDTLVEYRRVAKLKSSYVDNLIEAVERSTDGRIHATANVHGTEVGRLSFRDPALQTIPRESDLYGRVIKSAFMASPGNMLAILDYSQAEFRVFAAESKDPALLQAYADGRDIHDEVARGLYGEGFTKEQRVMAKMWDFAWIYGGTEHSFAQDAGMPLDQASAWVGRFNERFPVAVQWKRDKFLEAKSRGYVSTRTGRRRRFPLITRENLEEVRKGSVHSIVAGGASDCTLLSLVEAERRGLHPVLTVHDSIIIEEPEAFIEEATRILQAIMVATAVQYYPEVPWKVDPEIRKTWAERPT